jgi:hypothetical protein
MEGMSCQEITDLFVRVILRMKEEGKWGVIK